MKILAVGDIVGSAGINELKSRLKEIKEKENIDFTIVNGENSAEGMGITEKNFNDEVIKSDQTVLLDFYAEWCGPCNTLSPIIDEIANENKNIKVYKVNIDEEINLVNKFNIVSVPTILIFKNGEITSRVSGLTDKNQILSMVK